MWVNLVLGAKKETKVHLQCFQFSDWDTRLPGDCCLADPHLLKATNITSDPISINLFVCILLIMNELT